MKRFVTICALLLLCGTPALADVTITQTMTVEGKMGAMMGGATGGAMPTLVTRIKGLMSRTDVEMKDMSMATITDLTVPQFIILNAATRTAQIMGPGSASFAHSAAVLPKMDFTFKPSGRTQVIDGVRCEEHAFTMSANMAEMAPAGQMPPEAMAAMRDVRMAMKGSVWIATSGPGVADYVRFQKAATDAKMLAALTGVTPGGRGSLDQLMTAAAAAPGLPYLTEMTMEFEGTGKAVEMMRMMGPIEMTQRTTKVSTEPIADAMFKVPDGYTIEKP
jgi:hypothetical protein